MGARNNGQGERTTVAIRADLHKRLKVRAIDVGETLSDYLDAVLEAYLGTVDRGEQALRQLRGARVDHGASGR